MVCCLESALSVSFLVISWSVEPGEVGASVLTTDILLQKFTQALVSGLAPSWLYS